MNSDVISNKTVFLGKSCNKHDNVYSADNYNYPNYVQIKSNIPDGFLKLNYDKYDNINLKPLVIENFSVQIPYMNNVFYDGQDNEVIDFLDKLAKKSQINTTDNIDILNEPFIYNGSNQDLIDILDMIKDAITANNESKVAYKLTVDAVNELDIAEKKLNELSVKANTEKDKLAISEEKTKKLAETSKTVAEASANVIKTAEINAEERIKKADNIADDIINKSELEVKNADDLAKELELLSNNAANDVIEADKILYDIVKSIDSDLAELYITSNIADDLTKSSEYADNSLVYAQKKSDDELIELEKANNSVKDISDEIEALNRVIENDTKAVELADKEVEDKIKEKQLAETELADAENIEKVMDVLTVENFTSENKCNFVAPKSINNIQNNNDNLFSFGNILLMFMIFVLIYFIIKIYSNSKFKFKF
jgi:hypothetical protein